MTTPTQPGVPAPTPTPPPSPAPQQPPVPAVPGQGSAPPPTTTPAPTPAPEDWVLVPDDPNAPPPSTPPPLGGSPGTGPVIAGGMTLEQLLSLLAGNGGPNFSILNYNPDVMNNIPVLKVTRGETPLGEWEGISSGRTEIPALGVTLPSPGEMSFTMLNEIRNYDPQAWTLLDSLFRAGNRSLEAEYASAKMRAPIGIAGSSSLIRT